MTRQRAKEQQQQRDLQLQEEVEEPADDQGMASPWVEGHLELGDTRDPDGVVPPNQAGYKNPSGSSSDEEESTGSDSNETGNQNLPALAPREEGAVPVLAQNTEDSEELQVAISLSTQDGPPPFPPGDDAYVDFDANTTAVRPNGLRIGGSRPRTRTRESGIVEWLS